MSDEDDNTRHSLSKEVEEGVSGWLAMSDAERDRMADTWCIPRERVARLVAQWRKERAIKH
jgi:hypothetical protein